MKLQKPSDRKLKRDDNDDDGGSPPNVVPIKGNPFQCKRAKRVWARGGSKRGLHEVVIELEDGAIYLGAFKRLPGFFDAGTKRPPSKKLFD